MNPVYVLLVREADMQMSSSGCCGRIAGDATGWGNGECVFSERRQTMEKMGGIYRRLRNLFGDRIQVDMVDPRNLFSYTVLFWKGGRRGELPLRASCWNWIKGFSTTAILVNGVPLAVGRVPSTEVAIQAVAEELKKADGRKWKAPDDI